MPQTQIKTVKGQGYMCTHNNMESSYISNTHGSRTCIKSKSFVLISPFFEAV